MKIVFHWFFILVFLVIVQFVSCIVSWFVTLFTCFPFVSLAGSSPLCTMCTLRGRAWESHVPVLLAVREAALRLVGFELSDVRWTARWCILLLFAFAKLIESCLTSQVACFSRRASPETATTACDYKLLHATHFPPNCEVRSEYSSCDLSCSLIYWLGIII